MCIRMMSVGRSPSDGPTTDEAVRGRLSGTEACWTAAPGRAAKPLLGPARLISDCLFSTAWTPSRPLPGGSPGCRDAAIPNAVMGCNWFARFPTEILAAGTKAATSGATAGEVEAEGRRAGPRGKAGDAATAGDAEAEGCRAGPRGKAGDAATVAGAGRSGSTGAG